MFKLLCRPVGDAVLVPTPSYPLFDHLTRLDGVRAVPYRLEYHGGWAIDLGHARRGLDGRSARGAGREPEQPDRLGHRARRAGRARRALRLPSAPPSSSTRCSPTIRLARTARAPLEMPVGLPGLQAGWAVEVGGPAAGQAGVDGGRRAGCARRRAAMEAARADRRHLPLGLDTGAGGGAISHRVAAPMCGLKSWSASAATTVRFGRQPQAIPRVEVLRGRRRLVGRHARAVDRSEEELAIALLEEDDVLVAPGLLLRLRARCHLVLSLLPEPATFDEGVRRILERGDG